VVLIVFLCIEFYSGNSNLKHGNGVAVQTFEFINICFIFAKNYHEKTLDFFDFILFDF
jgi:hypothetical protein